MKAASSFLTVSAALLMMLTVTAAAQEQHLGSADRRDHHSGRVFHTADRTYHQR